MTEQERSLMTEQENKPACDSTYSRKEFLATLIRRATVAGALIAAPRILDKFVVPPVYASGSKGTGTRDTKNGDTKPSGTA